MFVYRLRTLWQCCIGMPEEFFRELTNVTVNIILANRRAHLFRFQEQMSTRKWTPEMIASRLVHVVFLIFKQHEDNYSNFS